MLSRPKVTPGAHGDARLSTHPRTTRIAVVPHERAQHAAEGVGPDVRWQRPRTKLGEDNLGVLGAPADKTMPGAGRQRDLYRGVVRQAPPPTNAWLRHNAAGARHDIEASGMPGHAGPRNASVRVCRTLCRPGAARRGREAINDRADHVATALGAPRMPCRAALRMPPLRCEARGRRGRGIRAGRGHARSGIPPASSKKVGVEIAYHHPGRPTRSPKRELRNIRHMVVQRVVGVRRVLADDTESAASEAGQAQDDELCTTQRADARNHVLVAERHANRHRPAALSRPVAPHPPAVDGGLAIARPATVKLGDAYDTHRWTHQLSRLNSPPGRHQSHTCRPYSPI